LVTLERVDATRERVLAGLLEEYVEELSPIFGVQRNSDGRFSYDALPAYWAHPETHFAFLIHVDGEVVGFALATKGSPASDDASVFDVAEFFVRRQHRGAGVGRRGASLLWRALPGRWIVRVAEANAAGLTFWKRTVAGYTRGAFSTKQHPGDRLLFRVFEFTA
jgi:predicted acetyltransferase